MKKTILRYLFFLFVFCNSGYLKAQMVYMPDPMLRAKLSSLGFASCIVGDSIDSSCPSILSTTSLSVYNALVTNLQGMQVFNALTNFDCSFNSISYLPPLPLSLQTLDCSNNLIDTLPVLPSSLTSLKCGGNQLTFLPTLLSGLSSLTTLYCSDNMITSLPGLPNSLTDFNCSINLLTSLPTLPTSLIYLYCGTNQLTSLPALPNSIQRIFCNGNQLTAMPALPPSLAELNCGNNLLTLLPVLPASLTFLECSNNPLTSLPALSPILSHLSCAYAQLTSLPPLPSTLEYLDCNHNQITSLPILPDTLWRLTCSNNIISSLPTLPTSLQYLYCDSNLLTTLPTLPQPLAGLYCAYNQLTTLPTLPPSLKNINCPFNQLTSLPELPDSMTNLFCHSNPSLTCLPEIKYINWIYFTNTGVTCVPNYGNVTTSTPNINGLPLCDLFNANGCAFYWNITGNTFFDRDSSCVKSASEAGVNNMRLLLYENGNLIQQAFTGSYGYYSFDVDNYGNYEVRMDTLSNPFSVYCPGTNNYLDTISMADSMVTNNDFALLCKPGFDAGVWSIVSSQLQPAHNGIIKIRAGDMAAQFGNFCTTTDSGMLTVTINGSATYVGPGSSLNIPSNISGNVLTYTLNNFLFTSSYFEIELAVDTFVAIGSQICIDVMITSPNDSNFNNNILSQCFTIVGSYDPNEKEVFPEGDLDWNQNQLTYTIHFQNTGTASADNIYILDTIDQAIDLSSFQLLATSHSSYVQILEGGIARFNFPNINLPDSNANEPLSHGYIQYKVRLKDSLAYGTQIRNAAHIFFDFNPPIATNTTLNTVKFNTDVSDFEGGITLNVWPVPFRNEFTIQIDKRLKGKNYSIVNMLGSEFSNGVLYDSQVRITADNWSPGIYFLRIKTNTNLIVRKLIKY